MITIKLMSKDMVFFGSISKFLKKPLIERLDMIIKAQLIMKQTTAQNNQNTAPKLDKNVETKSNEVNTPNANNDLKTNVNVTNQTSSTATSKLKALKFSQ